jgi:hypothetical protein
MWNKSKSPSDTRCKAEKLSSNLFSAAYRFRLLPVAHLLHSVETPSYSLIRFKDIGSYKIQDWFKQSTGSNN